MICPHCQKQNYNELAEICAYCKQPMHTPVGQPISDDIQFDYQQNASTEEQAAHQQELQSKYQPMPQEPYQPTYQPAQPVYQQPVYQQPQQPVYQQPVYQQPQQPVYQQPVYQQPQQPVYQQPAYQQPPQPAYQQVGKYCPVCGNICDAKAVICVRCGTNIAATSTEPDIPSTGLKVLSFLIPLIGFILYAVNYSSKPKSAKAYGLMGLISFGVGIGAYVLINVLLVLMYMFI